MKAIQNILSTGILLLALITLTTLATIPNITGWQIAFLTVVLCVALLMLSLLVTNNKTK